METEPTGYPPPDLLPGAKSLICLGLPVPRGMFKSRERSLRLYWRTANITYRRIDALLLQAACLIEEKGGTAVPVFGCFPYEVRGRGDLWGYVSLVRMAEAAGLGRVGKNGLLLNSSYGPRLILGGLITSAELQGPIGPDRDRPGCPADCFICQERCPVGAIEKNGRVDRIACIRHSMKSPIFSHLMKAGGISPEEVESLNHVTGVDDHSTYECLACVSSCPQAQG